MSGGHGLALMTLILLRFRGSHAASTEITPGRLMMQRRNVEPVLYKNSMYSDVSLVFMLPSASANIFPTASIMVRRRRITVYGTGILIQEPNIASSLFMSRTVFLFGPAIPVSCTLI